MPNLIAYDIAGVQPMSGPTGLIFAMRSRYVNQNGTEAFFNEADSAFSGQPAGRDDAAGFSDTAAGMVLLPKVVLIPQFLTLLVVLILLHTM
jgi:hypothetical protein